MWILYLESEPQSHHPRLSLAGDWGSRSGMIKRLGFMNGSQLSKVPDCWKDVNLKSKPALNLLMRLTD